VKNGEEIVQQTMLWNASLNEAYPMRGKEESHDYRYFPDPDLMPVEVNDEWMTELKSKLPELPTARKGRFIKDFSLPEYDAEILTSTKELADYYESILTGTKNYKAASNWLMGDTLSTLKEMKISIEEFPVEPNSIAELINLIDKGTISGNIAKSIFPEMIETGKSPQTIVKEKNLVQITDTSAIEGIVDSVLENNAAQVQEYLGGKEKVIGFLVGQVMKESKGKANPGAVNQILKKKLEEQR
jgi:aspartyl-tRNA(Asn)/glutamyl-tRNA(Gln) amidotransferase subunit B